MLNTEGRHPAVAPYGNRFRTGHLPEGLPRQVMEVYREAAAKLLEMLPDSPELTRALHRLWESKNEAVLHAVETQEADRGGR